MPYDTSYQLFDIVYKDPLWPSGADRKDVLVEMSKAFSGNNAAGKRYRNALRRLRDNKFASSTVYDIINILIKLAKPANMSNVSCALGRHVFGPLIVN